MTYIISPEEAAKIAGINNAAVIQLMKAAVPANSDLTKVDGTYKINTTLPVGVRMDIDGKQSFNTVNHLFTFIKGGETVSATVQVKRAGAVSIIISIYAEEHIGGSGN